METPTATEATARHAAPHSFNTLIVGAGQAGLATSYWLTQQGVEHQLLERRETLGGAWQDRWDAFCLNTPNFSLALPGMPYDGPAPEAFLLRNDLIEHFRHYAERIDAPVRTGADVTRIAPAEGGGFNVATTQGEWRARNLVLATGGYQRPKIPALSAQLPGHILQLHTDSYRNPGQLPDGAVLIVGTGQSGGQIAEELLAVGREIHLAVSTCPEAPRRYRGQDLLYWMMQLAQFGPDFGLNGLTVGQLPSPAARFACNPLVSGADGGHDIHLRDLGRRGVRLHGHLEAADDGDLVFSDDLPERLGLVEAAFYQRMKPMFDSYIAATGMSAPEPEPPRKDDWLPSEAARLNLEAANVTSVLWATGYRLDFSILYIPVLDEWNYPRHSRGVTEHPGVYAVVRRRVAVADRARLVHRGGRGPRCRVHCAAHRREHRRPVKATSQRGGYPVQGPSKSTGAARPAELNHSLAHAWTEGIASCSATSSGGASNTDFPSSRRSPVPLPARSPKRAGWSRKGSFPPSASTPQREVNSENSSGRSPWAATSGQASPSSWIRR